MRLLNRDGAKNKRLLAVVFLLFNLLKPQAPPQGGLPRPPLRSPLFASARSPRRGSPRPHSEGDPGAPPGPPPGGPGGIPREKPSALQSGAGGECSPSQAASRPDAEQPAPAAPPGSPAPPSKAPASAHRPSVRLVPPLRRAAFEVIGVLHGSSRPAPGRKNRGDGRNQAATAPPWAERRGMAGAERVEPPPGRAELRGRIAAAALGAGGTAGTEKPSLFCRLGTLGIPCPRPSPAPGRADGRRRRRGLRRRSGRYLTASAPLLAGAGVDGGEAVAWWITAETIHGRQQIKMK